MKKKCLRMILVVRICSNAEILHTINKNRVHSFKNVDETATIGFSGVLKVSKCCRNGNKNEKSVQNGFRCGNIIFIHMNNIYTNFIKKMKEKSLQ